MKGKEGVYYDLDEAAYHADPCKRPSLSYSLAKKIWKETPYAAWRASSRLNPAFSPEESSKFNIGNAAHALLLGGAETISVLDFSDYKTKDARALRDEILSLGKTPLLRHQHNIVLDMTNAARTFLKQTEIESLSCGKSEVSMFAYHAQSGIWERGRADWMDLDRVIVMDYKPTSCANPEYWPSFACKMGYDIQAAMYIKLNKLTGGPEDANFLWLVQEYDPPYLCSLIGALPQMVETGARKLSWCENVWARCLEQNTWPAYPTKIAWVEAPARELFLIESRELQLLSDMSEDELEMDGEL